MIVQLITDRTQEDVSYAESNKGSSTPNKGSYNAIDFNRVGTALNYLSDWLFSLGYGTNPHLRTNWVQTENMSYDDAMNYLSAINQVKRSILSFDHPYPVPRHISDFFIGQGFVVANNIESFMLYLESVITNMIFAFRHSGTFYSGFENGVRL